MEKVKTGDAVRIKASTWNAFVDTANYVQSARQNQTGCGLKSGVETGIVLVRNATGKELGQFAVVVLDGIAVTPAANEDEFLSCPPVFEGKQMSAALEGMPYAILISPAQPGEIVRAMVLGVTPAKVSIQSADHAFAVPVAGSDSGALESSGSGVARILWKAGTSGTQWCLLQLGGAGAGGDDGVVVCQVSGGTSLAGYSVRLFANGRTAESTGSGTLYLPELAIGSELPSGSWIIGHRSLIRATGGSET